MVRPMTPLIKLEANYIDQKNNSNTLKKIKQKFFIETIILTSVFIVLYVINYSEPSMGGWYMIGAPIPILIISFLNYKSVMIGVKLRRKVSVSMIFVYSVPLIALIFFAFKTKVLLLIAGLFFGLFNRAVMISINELNSIPPATLPESKKP